MYQKTRKFLFFSCLILFLFLLPAIILFTFGYKVDWRTLRILKTGIILVSSSPEGAQVYLDGKFLDINTPATIDELLPGRYSISLLLDGYYPWQGDIDVYPGRVASVSNVMLFSRIHQFDKLNFEETYKFFVFNQDKDSLYYVIRNSKIIHKVNSDSGKLERVFNVSIFPATIENIVLSADREKLLCNDNHNIAVIYLTKPKFKHDFLFYCRDNIQQVFWHSDSEHFIVVTNKDIKVYDLFSEGKGNVVTVAKLIGKHQPAYYDQATDTLFFLNLQEAPDKKRYENIYKIVIGQRFSFPFLRGHKNK